MTSDPPLSGRHRFRDHYLPPDPDAYRRAVRGHRRIVVIAPTRAACETIENALDTRIDTILSREHGDEIRAWAREGVGFGIMAGTGTGKTLAIRLMAEAMFEGEGPIRSGVVNREREATPDTPTWHVVIVTTGIARRWFQADLIFPEDTIVVDEIHQTSAELELCLALAKRVGCRMIWLSATVDADFYRRYLESTQVIESSAFDDRLRARVTVTARKPFQFLDHRFLRHVISDKRGVAVFLPTRAEVEEVADVVGRRRRGLTTAFYHGGEPIGVIRPFLDGEVERPFLLAMTAAGQSALNVPGLDTVVIYDAQYRNVIERGRNVLTRQYLGPNELLQMAGRVHGRVPNGEVIILSDRDLDFDSLVPVPPAFQLGGDSERVALTAAALGVDLTELDLPVPLDREAYRRAVHLLTGRGIVEDGRLTAYGRDVEAMPVERPWGELLVAMGDDLTPFVAVAAGVESLHRMTRDEFDLQGLIVEGSDHLTGYNVYAEAVARHGAVGNVHGLVRHVFDPAGIGEWAERRGVLVKALEDIALGTASIYRTLERRLPDRLPPVTADVEKRFRRLVARVMPFDLVIDERTADHERVRIGRGSTCSNWGAVAGHLRHFADRRGIPRAAIEGTNLSLRLIREFAERSEPEVEFRTTRRHQGGYLVVVRRLEYFGFELDRTTHPLEEPFPDALAASARTALVDALVRGKSSHPDQRRLKRTLDRIGEYWRRSGGTLPDAAPARVRALLAERLAEVRSRPDFENTRLDFDLDRTVPVAVQRALDLLPSSVSIRGDTVPIEYGIEHGAAVATVRLREGQARRIRPEDLPGLDRPIRFALLQGRGRPPLRAGDLDELAALLADLPRRSERRGRRGGRGGGPGRGGRRRVPFRPRSRR